MKGSVKHGKNRNESKLQEALEGMFAEACLSTCYDGRKHFRIAEELCALVKEMVQIHAVAYAWDGAGERRAYEASVCISSDAIRKGSEWQKTKSEADSAASPPFISLNFGNFSEFNGACKAR